MKKFYAPVFLIFSLCATISDVNAQGPMTTFNQQLRAMFIYVVNPNTNVHFFYDMASHITDSTFFGSYVTDTSNVNTWYLLHREMYHAAYDTNSIWTSDQVFNLPGHL